MTRDQIADGLSILVLQIANNDLHLPNGWQPHDWAYVRGLASFRILELRDRLGATWNSPPAGGVSETHGGD